MSERPDLRLIGGDKPHRPRLRSVRLGPSFDLLAAYPGHGGFFFERDGAGVAAGPGSLEASSDPVLVEDLHRLAAPLLDRLRVLEGATGASPVAVGGIPFSPKDVVHVFIFRTRPRMGDIGRSSAVVNSYFAPFNHKPTTTNMAVLELGEPEQLVEIQVVAVVD